eukprot:6197704-Pleurochrysis_carterae.AAC.4
MPDETGETSLCVPPHRTAEIRDEKQAETRGACDLPNARLSTQRPGLNYHLKRVRDKQRVDADAMRAFGASCRKEAQHIDQARSVETRT